MNPISPLDFKLETIFNKKKEDVNKSSSDEHRGLERALLLLRLFKPSTLRIGAIETKPLQWVPMGGIISTGRTKEEYFSSSYKLNKEEIPQLIDLWSVVNRINFSNCPSLEIAIRRFNFAHERDNLEDRLIDIMIGFETLYLDDDKEITYKTSLRPAILIGKDLDLDERNKIYKIMKTAYEKRSKLVHSGKLENKVKISDPVNREFSMDGFIDVIKDYLSNSIKTFARLSATYTHEQILYKIHESTLTTGIALE